MTIPLRGTEMFCTVLYCTVPNEDLPKAPCELPVDELLSAGQLHKKKKKRGPPHNTTQHTNPQSDSRPNLWCCRSHIQRAYKQAFQRASKRTFKTANDVLTCKFM